MLYLEAELGSLGQLGDQPAWGTIVSGIQQLNPGIADDVLTLLANRLPITAQQAGAPVAVAQGVTNFVAVTPERLAQLGIATSEATQNAADYIRGLPNNNYALADVNDVGALETNKPGFSGDFHFTVATAEAVPYIAGPGMNLAILAPIGGGANTASTVETPKKSMGPALIGAAVGGVGGALVAGPIGAVVGGVGGFLVGNAVA